METKNKNDSSFSDLVLNRNNENRFQIRWIQYHLLSDYNRVSWRLIVLPEYDFLYKICIAGSENAGKSSIIYRHEHDEFRGLKPPPTIGLSFFVLTHEIGGVDSPEIVKAAIWISSPNVWPKGFWQAASCIILVFDYRNGP